MGPMMLAALPFVVAGGAVAQSIGSSVSDAYQAKVATNNAIIAKQYGKWVNQQGDIGATNEGLKTRAEIGATRAKYAGGGIDVNTGSAAQVQAAESEIGRFDALTIRSNAARQAYGEDIKAAGFEADAHLLKQKSVMDLVAGATNAAGAFIPNASFLSTASSVAKQASGDLDTLHVGGLPQGAVTD